MSLAPHIYAQVRRAGALAAAFAARSLAMLALSATSVGDAPGVGSYRKSYTPARGFTNALKIRRAATKQRNVQRHRVSCR